MEYDDINNNYIMLGSANILDYPEFPHRGIMLDTSRNFIQKSVIKRIIDGMAHSKVQSCQGLKKYKKVDEHQG